MKQGSGREKKEEAKAERKKFRNCAMMGLVYYSK